MKHCLSDTFGDFRCIHCHQVISADIRFSGVNNRNHCPYCLYSRHLDWREAGDRMSACKGAMQPVGLALKRAHKKYGSDRQGELMLVHRCAECGKISANRIAADDVAEFVLEVFWSSLKIDAVEQLRIRQAGVELLTAGDAEIVQSRLFGWEAARQDAAAPVTAWA